MFKSYVLIALRKFSREKTYVFINILSLALGIASFLLLTLYLRSELTYDRHHVNHERIYRVTAHFRQEGGESAEFASTQVGIGPLLVKDYPQLGKQVRIRPSQQNVLEYEDKKRQWERIFLADPSVFEIFTHKPLYGDPATAFKDLYSIAISETLAKYYFGDENPIGKKLSSGAYSYVVTLVFEDLPENTHLKYDALYPFQLMNVFFPGFESNYENTLFNVQLYTYLMVPPEFDAKDFASISQNFFDTHMVERAKQSRSTFEAKFQPLASVHFGEKLEGDQLLGNIFYVYGFAAVAIFILAVACINYVNLATARASKRAKEVGMRKVLGASQSQLIRQFLGESLTFTAIALLVAVIVIALALLLTPIGSLMDKQHLLVELGRPQVIVGTLVFAALIGLISGLYPALYLASISPLAALTQVKRSWKAGFTLRQVLVFSQLCISIGVIACTLLMMDQMRYINERPLGFEKENKLIVTLRGYDVIKDIKTIKGELRRLPNVLGVTTIGPTPGADYGLTLGPVENNAGVMEPVGRAQIGIGVNFAEVMRLEVVEGRSFSEDIATDLREALLVNESFVAKMAWDNPLGKRLQGGPRVFRVVGVVKDFHYAPLHTAIGPLVIFPMGDDPGIIPENQRPLLTQSIIVSMTGEAIRETVDEVQSVVAKFDPKLEFEPVFLDERLTQEYKSEANLMKLTGIFAGVCILISVMGIFGLAAFTTEQRTKEIGVRKVLGASDLQIVTMLSRPLLWLVLIAAIPASYLGYRAIDTWLQRFAYHTDISWMTFAFATLLVCLISITTVVLQSLRTSSGNPVDALRYE